jgi:hypothetical protein
MDVSSSWATAASIFNVLEVLIGQMGQYREIDLVLSKALCVLGHAKLFEPVRYLQHRVAALRRTSRRC